MRLETAVAVNQQLNLRAYGSPYRRGSVYARPDHLKDVSSGGGGADFVEGRALDNHEPAIDRALRGIGKRGGRALFRWKAAIDVGIERHALLRLTPQGLGHADVILLALDIYYRCPEGAYRRSKGAAPS